MNEKTLLGLLAVGLVAFVTMGAVAAFPFGGNAALNDEELNALQERRQAIHDAIENGDYGAWKAAIESELTEENFQRMMEAFQNRQENGLPEGNGFRNRARFGFHNCPFADEE